MTVEEAVSLVVQAGVLGRDGEVLVLDMGEPVRICDVAERMIANSGRKLSIEITGLRPGEKLHEVLLGQGEVDTRPLHPSLSQVHVPALNPVFLHGLLGPEVIESMIDLCANGARRWTDLDEELAPVIDLRDGIDDFDMEDAVGID
jgi:hypothetical protein